MATRILLTSSAYRFFIGVSRRAAACRLMTEPADALLTYPPMTTTTKADLIQRLAEKDRLLPAESEQAKAIILDELKHAVLEGRRIEIRGFGAFHAHERKARHGRNPRSSAPMEVAAKRVVVFKPSPAFTERVNGD